MNMHSMFNFRKNMMHAVGTEITNHTRLSDTEKSNGTNSDKASWYCLVGFLILITGSFGFAFLLSQLRKLKVESLTKALKNQKLDEANTKYNEQLNLEEEELSIIIQEFSAFNGEVSVLVKSNNTELTPLLENSHHGRDCFDADRLTELMNGYPDFPEDKYQTVDDYVAGLEAYSLKRAQHHENVVCLAKNIFPCLQTLLEETKESISKTTGWTR